MISTNRQWFQIAVVVAGFSAAAGCFAQQPVLPGKAAVQESPESVVLANGYVRLTFDRATHRVVQISADHTGRGTFEKNLLAPEGIRFDKTTTKADSHTNVEILAHRIGQAAVRLSWRLGDSRRNETVTMRLDATGRGPEIEVACTPSASACGDVSMSLQQWFLLGAFRRGVMQYVAGQGQSFTSHDPLQLFYTMDHVSGSIAIVPETPEKIAETTLVSTPDKHVTGIEMRLDRTGAVVDQWIPLSDVAPATSSKQSAPSRTLRFRLYANDLPYPAHRSENAIVNGDAQQSRDSEAYFTAVYGSAAGVLGSYLEPGSGYPTLSTPRRAYGTGFNFFDPDAWEVVTPLSYSGDPLLQNEARKILERSESGMLADGQIPHHFQNGVPVYLSIAKSKQTGPNLFWTLAALEYSAATGNEAWLRAHYSHLQQATEWILKRFDEREQLLNVEGPLFIDVFKRSGYTLDTNAAAIFLLQQMAEAADFCNDPASKARYLDFARKIKAGINQHLWNGSDHFVTQQNPDGTLRDLVDYDGNFAALAFGVVDDRATEETILHRLDSGPHTHPDGRGTWVSEKSYLKNDCYGGNTGDSNVAMGRIWWFDSLTRVRMGDHAMFDSLLTNIESDLLRETWMHERYNARGGPAHNPYYHEYPEVVSMVLREQRYGVHVGMREVRIDPFGVQHFQIKLGSLQVSYSPKNISISVPGSSNREFAIGGLPAHTRYALPGGKRASTNDDGWLRFHAPAGKHLEIRQLNSHRGN